MEINWKIIFHQLKEPFKISHGTYHQRKALIVMIEMEHEVGYGECTEIDYYGIHLEEFEVRLTELKPLLSKCKHEHPFIFFKFLKEYNLHPFLQSAIDCAYWDVYGKWQKKTFAELNDFAVESIPQSSLTLSIDSMGNQIEQIKKLPWDFIKVKAETWNAQYRDGLVATGKNISVDSNGSFTLEQCRFIEEDPKSAHFVYFEQPMPKGEANFSVLHSAGFANWTADEDLQNIHDLDKLKNHYKTVNIKVMKCGGLTPSLEIIKRAKEMGFQIMIGCMTESTVGIAAGIALAHLADFLDLDGANLIVQDIAQGPQVSNGYILRSTNFGLGIKWIG